MRGSYGSVSISCGEYVSLCLRVLNEATYGIVSVDFPDRNKRPLLSARHLGDTVAVPIAVSISGEVDLDVVGELVPKWR